MADYVLLQPIPLISDPLQPTLQSQNWSAQSQNPPSTPVSQQLQHLAHGTDNATNAARVTDEVARVACSTQSQNS